MKKMPKHYSLVREHPGSYEVHDSRDDSKFHVAKQSLDLGMHGRLATLPHYSEGTDSVADSALEAMTSPNAVAPRSEASGQDFTAHPYDRLTDDYLSRLPDSPNLYVDKFDPTADFQSSGMFQSHAPASAPPPPAEIPEVAAPASPEKAAAPKSAPAGSAPGSDLMGRYNASQAAMESGAQNLGAAQAAQANEEAAAREKSNYHLQGVMNEAQAERDAFEWKNQKLSEQVAAAKIDPNHYMSSMSTGNKIIAAIAMALGGAGAAASGQKNLAHEVIQDAINKDIEAQRSNLDTKKSLLSMNMEKYKDARLAQQATFMQMQAMAQGQVAQIAAKHGGAIDQAKTQMLLGQMKQESLVKGMEFQNAVVANGIKQSLLSGNTPVGGDPAAYVQYVVPKEHQAKVFGEIGAAQNTRNMSERILQSFEDAVKENTAMKTGAGFARTPGSVFALHQNMQPTFADLEGTVRQAAMDNTFKNITPAPGDSDHTISQKREALQGYLQSKLAAPTAKGFGIDLSRFQTTAPAGSHETQMRNGIPYKKVPGGWVPARGG